MLAGYNATVFAYGATGGGKTYTMVGAPDKPGIMVSAGFAGQTELNTSLEQVRALNQLFGAEDESSVRKVTMSYLEIYNENIRDLLDPSSGYLELRDESRGRNIQVSFGVIQLLIATRCRWPGCPRWRPAARRR